MKQASLVALTLAAACSPASPPADPAPPITDNYRAVGTEPGWTVTITPNRIEYQGDYGETRISMPHAEPRTTFNGHRYEAKTEAHTLVVDVTHVQCNDGMSDRVYPDSVMVIADGKTVKGCGGATIPPQVLAGTNWTIASVAGSPVQGGRPATLAFTEDRVSGSSGCNRFSGGYTQTGDRLTIAPVMATKMACLGPAMDLENKLFAILRAEVSISYRDGDTLVISSRDGGEVVLKRAI